MATAHEGKNGEGEQEQGLTADPAEATARPGRGWSSRIPDESAGGQRLKTRLGTTLQGFRRGLDPWRGRAGRSGAPELSGRARGARWTRRQWTAATGRSGREQRGEGRELQGGEKCRGSRGVRGDVQSVQASRGRGRQGGGVASSAASRCPSSAYWHEEEGDREEAVVGWAGQLQCWAGWWRQVSAPGRLSLSLWFFYLLMFSIFCNWF